jgi:hypothetical protein
MHHRNSEELNENLLGMNIIQKNSEFFLGIILFFLVPIFYVYQSGINLSNLKVQMKPRNGTTANRSFASGGHFAT